MIYIGFHLHAYQPPTQPQRVIDEIYRQSYEPVIRLAETNKNVFFSLDIAKSLGERLPQEFLERIGELARNQGIELVNTPAYHYLLPLVPFGVIARQLELNLQFYREKLGVFDPIPGIWPPELAYHPAFPKIFRSLGYRWCVADDKPRVLQMEHHVLPDYRVPHDLIFSFDEYGVLLRSHKWSELICKPGFTDGARFAKNLILNIRGWFARCNPRQETETAVLRYSDDHYLILARDFETFGHHHPGTVEQFLNSFFEEISKPEYQCEIAELDFIYSHFEKSAPPTPLPPGSWATDNLSLPYPCWKNPDNEFHRYWNEFMELTFGAAPENPEPELQNLLDHAFYSCSPWWATKSTPQERAIAGWCLPAFQRIVELLPADSDKIRLQYLLRQMEHWVARNKIAP